MIVTGVPGSGKTTLGNDLAAALGLPFLSLDAIKERLHACSAATQDRFALRLAAEQEMLALLDTADGSAVVDIWVAPDRDTQRVSELLERSDRHIVEVLCRVPASVAAARYERRGRRGGPHLAPDEPTLQMIRVAAGRIEPLGLGDCIEVDTSQPVDVSQLVDDMSL